MPPEGAPRRDHAKETHVPDDRFELRRAGPDRIEDAVAFVDAFHEIEGLAPVDKGRRDAIALLLAHPEYGSFLFIEVDDLDVGYIAVGYGFSIEFCGRDAFLDEFYVEAAHRGRGLGRAALKRLKSMLPDEGIKALHLEVGVENPRAAGLYEDEGFIAHQGYSFMSIRFTG
ncbi:MAG: GNAT family N-acetyltransferase [Pseudomonadota bacterium]